MADTNTSTTNGVDWADVIDELAGAGYGPIDAYCDDHLVQPRTRSTIEYFAARRWDAVRVLSDSIQFARFGDEGCKVMSTTMSGCISTEASFSCDRHGVRMFTMAAELRP